MRQVIIESWKADSNYTYIHQPGCFSVNGKAGDAVEASFSDCVEILQLAGMLKKHNDQWHLNANCIDACELVSQVLCYSDKEIEKIREQFESLIEHFRHVDEHDKPIRLSRFELALLDIQAREHLAQVAREVDNPFTVDKDNRDYLLKVADDYLRAKVPV